MKERSFDFQFVKSKTYCQTYFSQLNPEDKQTVTGYLKEFVEQPFIKTKNVTPELTGKTQHSKASYLYWINTNSLKQTAIQPEAKTT